VQVEADGDNGHADDEHGHRKTSKAAGVGAGGRDSRRLDKRREETPAGACAVGGRT